MTTGFTPVNIEYVDDKSTEIPEPKPPTIPDSILEAKAKWQANYEKTQRSRAEWQIEYDKKEQFRREVNQQYKETAQKIADVARKTNGETPKPVDWDEWSVSRIEPRDKPTLGSLKDNVPELISVLETPSGDVEARRDLIDDNTRIVSVGYWQNGRYHSGLEFTLTNESDKPHNIRRISLDYGHWISRRWENSGWIGQSKIYEEDDDNRTQFSAATKQVDTLVDKIVSGNNFNAAYTSHTEKVGKEYWET